jgi:hypothetical protein
VGVAGYGGDDMNLTGRDVVAKNPKRTRSNKPTQAQYAEWEQQKLYGCSVEPCYSNICLETHHCLTGAGGRKDHDKTICLCYYHHRGGEGIHTIGRKEWQRKYGTEQYHMDKDKKRRG